MLSAKSYLNQAYRLECKLKLQRRRIEELQDMRGSVSSPGFDEYISGTKKNEAPFISIIEKIWEYEEKESKRMALLLALREQIRECIDKMENPDEALVLEHRYLYNLSWCEIGKEMYVDERTVRRWHNKALAHFKVPENPIIIS